nr:DUF2852 domain-containing protein [Enterovirga rhinocerotis]
MTSDRTSEGRRACSGPRGSRRALEIVGIVFLFFYFWPAAAAYVAWKIMGYPGLNDAREIISRQADDLKAYRFSGTPFSGGGFGGGTGNAAFDAYRREEIERLERERRRLDEEAREFRTFVEELKRAKDREEFDAYMAKRRSNGPVDV